MKMFDNTLQLDKEKMPKHVAVIMDGNGRWAAKRNLVKKAGHKAGADTLEKVGGGGHVLLVMLHHIRVKTAGLDRFLQDVPVIERDSQFLCHLLADGMAACAVFPADGNDLIHGTPPHRSRLLTGPILSVSKKSFRPAEQVFRTL